MHHLDKQQKKALRNKLHEEKRGLLQQLEHNDNYGLSTPLREITGDSSVDNHPADQGTEVYERAKDIALNERTERAVSRIDDALSKLESGEYGVCEQCGQPIPYERLEVVPYTSYCVEHSPNQFVSERRPIEESFLGIPYTGASSDDHEDTQFDGEDTWHIVEQWGTSSSPALAEHRNVAEYDDFMMESDDEPDGFVQPVESFLATDMYGNVSVIRNDTYEWYMATDQGDRTLESGLESEEGEQGNPEV